MSNPLYKPYTSGNQGSNKGQYTLSTFPSENHPRRGGSPHGRPESSFSSSSVPPVGPQSSNRMFPSPMSHSMAYRPEQSRTRICEEMERSADMHISGSSKDIHHGKPTYEFMDQNAGFASSQREEFVSTGTERDRFSSLGTGRNYSVPSSSLVVGQRHSNLQSGSLDWLSKYEKPASSSSGLHSSSIPSTYTRSGEDCFSAPSRREHHQQSKSGFGESSSAYAQSTQQKYNSQSAADILLHFGLEKEDLEQLISYPEEEITPDNLPFILRKIRIQKTKREATASQSNPFSEPQPTRSMVGMDRNDLYTPGGLGNLKEEKSTTIPQTSNVIEYGHTCRYTRGVADDFRRTSGSESALLVDNSNSFKQVQEHLKNDAPDKISSAGGFTQDQVNSSTNRDSFFQPLVKPVGQPSKSNPTFQSINDSVKLQKQGTDFRSVQSETGKPVASAIPKADQHVPSKVRTVLPAVKQVRTGFVLYDSKTAGGIKNEVNTPAQSSSGTEEIKKRRFQEETRMQKPSLAQQQAQKEAEQNETPVPPTDTGAWTSLFASVKAGAPASTAVNIASISQTAKYPVILPKGPQPNSKPPVQPQPVASLTNRSHLVPASSHIPAKDVAASKSLPDLALMHDYAATTPKSFPHTCSLCKKGCRQMADWISHQNTSLHLERCKLLRTQYPDWDGEIALGARHVDGEVKRPSTSGSAPAKQPYQKKPRRKSPSYSSSQSSSRSRSRSPHYQDYASERRRDRRRSRSRSPYRSRHSRRSRSRSYSPTYDRKASRRYPSRSRSPQRRSSPPRRNVCRSPPRRNDRRASPPRRSSETRRSPRRSTDRQGSMRRNRDGSSSSESDSSPQRMSEMLAKKLLGKSDVQSLAQQSDIEAVVKTLAPALMAELAKIKSSSVSSTDKSAARSSLKKSEESSASFKVKLSGLTPSISYDSVKTAIESFGKVESLVLYRSINQVNVAFDKEEDALKLITAKHVEVNGGILAVRKTDAVSEEKATYTKNPSTSTASMPSGPKTAPADKPRTPATESKNRATTSQTAKQKVTSSVPDGSSTKQLAKTSNLEKMSKKATSKKDPAPKSKAPENQSDIGPTEDKPALEKCDNAEKETVIKETAAVDKPDSQVETCSAEPEKTGENAGGASEPMETESVAACKEENLIAVDSEEREPSAEGPSESQPSTSTLEIPAAETQTVEQASTKDDSSKAEKPSALKTQQQQPSTSSDGAGQASTLTIGDAIGQHLQTNRIVCLKNKTCFSPKFFKLGKRELVISMLPEYSKHSYSEEELVQLLTPFGFQNQAENIYVIPQLRMAFVRMPTIEMALALLMNFEAKKLTFKEFKIRVRLLGCDVAMSPLGFYKYLMKLMKTVVADDGQSLIFIKNISQSKIKELRGILMEKIQGVKNFLPLLNKVFVEFESPHDADRLGVWYSLLREDLGLEVYRQKIPREDSTSLSPRHPERAFPHGEDAATGTVVPPVSSGVPQGTVSPYWVPLRRSPFLFPTKSPWFIIPDHLMVKEEKDIEEAAQRGSMCPTLMLTGLPESKYTQQDVAALVWPYLSKQNLHSLYYNVIVLPLQRRAFVFFPDWSACCSFVRSHIAKPVTVKDFSLGVHFVLQDMHPEPTEEMLYKAAMKWSNIGVGEPKSLDERLLVVETTEMSVNIAILVMEAVGSISSFVGFLPLGNRVCVEMADSAGVAQVMSNHKNFALGSTKKHTIWSNILHFKTLKDLKQCLQDAGETVMQLGLGTADTDKTSLVRTSEAQPGSSMTVEHDSKPALQTGLSESPSSLPSSACASQDAHMEVDGEKPEAEVLAEAAGVLENAKDAEETRAHDQPAESGPSSAEATPVVDGANTCPAPSVAEPRLATLSVTEPRPVTPSVAEPRPLTPSVTDPRPVTPSVAEPRPVTPSVADPRPVTPSVTDPRPVTPSVTDPRPVTPSVAEPRPVTPSVTDPRPVTPSVAEPRPVTPSVAEPRPVTPSVAEPRTVAEPRPVTPSGQVEINEEIFKALKAAVDERRIILAGKAELQKNKAAEDSGQYIARSDRTSVLDHDFHSDSFVVIDEIYDDSDKQEDADKRTGKEDGSCPDFDTLDDVTDVQLQLQSREGSSETQQAKESLQVVDDGAAGDRGHQEVGSQLDMEEGKEASVEEDSAGRQPSQAETDGLEKSSTKRAVGTLKRDSDATEPKEEEEEEEEEEATSSVKQSEEDEVKVAAAPERGSRRRSARAKKEEKASSSSSDVAETTIKDEESSVQKENVDDESAVVKRVTRGQRNRQGNKETVTETTRKESTPSRRRSAPCREESTPTRKSEEDKETSDSTEEPLVQDVRTTAGRKRGRPPGRAAKVDKKGSAAAKKDDEETSARPAACEEPGEEEEHKAKESHEEPEEELVDEQIGATKAEPQVESQQEESADASGREATMTAEKAEDPDESSAAGTQDNDAEERMDLLVQEPEEEQETPRPRTRGRGQKRARQTAVRKSTREKRGGAIKETEAEDVEPPVPALGPSSLPSSEAEPEDATAAPGGQEVQPQGIQTMDDGLEGGEEEEEGLRRANIKAESKQRRDPAGPQEKHRRSESPSPPAKRKLPAFKPNNPLGQEFVVPTAGFYCSLCSIFYVKEKIAKERHCSSRRHYDNLQRHYEESTEEPSTPPAQSSTSP